MKIEFNALSFASSAADAIRQHFISALRDSEEVFLEIMEREVLRTVNGGGPGKPGWRASIRDRLDIVEETFTDSFLEGKVGLDNDLLYSDFVKAMLIAYGSGSAGLTGICMTAGPAGRIVWDDDLSGQGPSKVQEQRMLPSGFNQSGNEFIENSVRIMKNRFTQILNDALAG